MKNGDVRAEDVGVADVAEEEDKEEDMGVSMNREELIEDIGIDNDLTTVGWDDGVAADVDNSRLMKEKEGVVIVVEGDGSAMVEERMDASSHDVELDREIIELKENVIENATAMGGAVSLAVEESGIADFKGQIGLAENEVVTDGGGERPRTHVLKSSSPSHVICLQKRSLAFFLLEETSHFGNARTIELILLQSVLPSWEFQIHGFYMDGPFEDIFSEPAAKHGPAMGKFQPKGRFGPKKGPSLVGTSTVPPNEKDKSSSLRTSTTEANSTEPIIPAIHGSRSYECSLSEDIVGSSGIDNSSAAQNHSSHAEDVFSAVGTVSVDGISQIDKDRTETEGEPVFTNINSAGNLHERDAVSSLGKSPTGGQNPGEDPGSTVFSSVADPGQEPSPRDVNAETEYPNAGSFFSDSRDDIFDYSAISFDDAGDLVSHLPNVDMSGNISDPRQPVTLDSGDAMPPVMATSAPSDMSYDGLAWSENSEQQENVSAVGTSRQPRMAASSLVEELDEENNDHANNLNASDNYGEDQLYGDIEGSKNSSLAKKGAPRNMKKSQEKKQKTNAQEKRVSDEDPERSPEKPRKKFSHSTRRNKRRVDEKLLQIPEDEIDYRKLRMRDLILLAEHRERLTNKKTKTGKPSPNNQSADKTSCRDASSSGKESSVSEQDGDPSDQVDNDQPTITLFNYNSFMERTPRARWSKQDTELFYAGIRQFGTDLAMIKELFPNLTRQQVKLKYKKEERQNQLRLSDALASRAKDHSHFQLVIERLQAAAQVAKESSVGCSVGGSGDEAVDSAAETNEEVENPRTEAAEDGLAGDADIHENSPKLDESESEDNIFDKLNSYKSEF